MYGCVERWNTDCLIGEGRTQSGADYDLSAGAKTGRRRFTQKGKEGWVEREMEGESEGGGAPKQPSNASNAISGIPTFDYKGRQFSKEPIVNCLFLIANSFQLLPVS